ncbi:MAG: FdhE protein [Desulfobacteraceae bacterium Eth-SRB1]|nr:MAG: FdhE protein [Desulfobacteraceae bacterium Eth-SRB1]
MQDDKLRAFQERLKILRRKYPDYGYFFDFYGTVILTRINFSQRPEIESVAIEEEMVKLKLNDGFPLIETEAFQIDTKHAQALFFALCRELIKERNEVKPKIEVIESYFQSHPEKLKEIFADFLKEEKLKDIENIDLDINLLQFLVFHSLKPSLKESAQAVKSKLENSNWTKGYCPVCGHHPYMAALRENGKKYVKCSFCGHEWSIERILCPFCDNKDHEQLRYIKADGEEGYRVYLCDKCKRYLKTVDERTIENVVDLDMEDVATLHLDIIAEKEGYRKG